MLRALIEANAVDPKLAGLAERSLTSCFAIRNIQSVIDNFTSGHPRAHGEVSNEVFDCVEIMNLLAAVITEVAALIQTNPGRLETTQPGWTGSPHPTTKRVF